MGLSIADIVFAWLAFTLPLIVAFLAATRLRALAIGTVWVWLILVISGQYHS